MTTSGQVVSLYRTVVEDVIISMKEAFSDEGVDSQVLQELKQLWESKLQATKALRSGSGPDVRMTNPALSVLYQEQHPALRATVNQGYLPSKIATTQEPPSSSQPKLPQQDSASSSQSSRGTTTSQQTITVPIGVFQQQISALGGQRNITLQPTGSVQYVAVHSLPGQHGSGGLQQQAFISQAALQAQHVAASSVGHVTQNMTHKQAGEIIQLDGAVDATSSSDEDDYENDEIDDNVDDDQNDNDVYEGEEEEPLNSNDDVSEEDPTELFDSDNVIVCQYDKINRNKNKWKFHLKDGIMNLNGKDLVFQKASGDAEW